MKRSIIGAVLAASEEDLLALLKPRPVAMLKIWSVDDSVGNVNNIRPHLAVPV